MHARAPAHHPQPRTLIFLWRMRNERPSSSVVLQKLLPDQGRAADQAASNPGQPRSTMISPFAAQRCDFCRETQGGREKGRSRLGQNGHAACMCDVRHMQCALHQRARARALLRYTHFVLCAANNAFVHARAPAHHPQPRTLIFLWRMRNERPSSSVVLQKLLPDQGRAADQAASPGQPRSTMISPILRRRPNGTASPRAIRRRPPGHPQTTTGPSADDLSGPSADDPRAVRGRPLRAIRGRHPGRPQTTSGHPQTTSGHPQTTRLDPSALDGNHQKDGSLWAMNTQASQPRRAKSKLLPTFPVVYLRHDAKWPVTWKPSMHAGKAQMGHIRQ